MPIRLPGVGHRPHHIAVDNGIEAAINKRQLLRFHVLHGKGHAAALGILLGLRQHIGRAVNGCYGPPLLCQQNGKQAGACAYVEHAAVAIGRCDSSQRLHQIGPPMLGRA